MLGAATKRAFFQKMNITRIYAVRRSEIKRNQAAWYAKKSKKKKRKKRRRRRIRTRPVETSGNRGGEEKKTNVDSTAVSSQVLTFFSIPSFFFYLSYLERTFAFYGDVIERSPRPNLEEPACEISKFSTAFSKRLTPLFQPGIRTLKRPGELRLRGIFAQRVDTLLFNSIPEDLSATWPHSKCVFP